MSKTQTILLLLVFALSSFGISERKKIYVDKSFKIPKYRAVPSLFDDITYLERERKLMVANSVGMGEFPLHNDEVILQPPGFTAPCAGCNMRGFVQTLKVPTTALVWAKRVLSVMISRRKTLNFKLPREITDASGISHDGIYYLISDRKAKSVFRLELEQSSKTAKIVEKIAVGRKVEAVTFENKRIWITNGKLLLVFSNSGKKIKGFYLPVKISGIAFVGDYLWATAKRKPVILKCIRLSRPFLKKIKTISKKFCRCIFSVYIDIASLHIRSKRVFRVTQGFGCLIMDNNRMKHNTPWHSLKRQNP